MTNHFKILNKQLPQERFEAIVGMAVYGEDRLEWIKQSIDSVLNQTYSEFWLVVIMDGKLNDDIYQLLNSYTNNDARVILIEGTINSGLSTCMNFIIEWSQQFSPQFFFRMDADDISEPNRFSTQIDFLTQHPDISILGSGLIEIDEYGIKVGKRKLPLLHKDIVNFLPKRCSMNHPTVVFRYSVFIDGYRYRENLRNTQDYFLWIELSAAGYKFANLGVKLLRFRRVNDFYKRRGLKKSINEFKARMFAMKALHKLNFGNLIYAISVLTLRVMPPIIVKLAYKLDRLFLEKYIKH